MKEQCSNGHCDNDVTEDDLACDFCGARFCRGCAIDNLSHVDGISGWIICEECQVVKNYETELEIAMKKAFKTGWLRDLRRYQQMRRNYL